MLDQLWTALPLVAFDVVGTGGRDWRDQAVLEVAAVPVTEGRPNMAAAWAATVNPGRRVEPKPWISPELTGDALAHAPTLQDLRATIAGKLNGRYLVGHDIGDDWRLLNLRLSDIRPAGLIDTARLAEYLWPGTTGRSLLNLLGRYDLDHHVEILVPDKRVRRATWKAVGAAVLLSALAGQLPIRTDSRRPRSPKWPACHHPPS
ncbi:3'-5' exonuclease [Nonomuraea sp. NPDC004702]